MRAPLALVLLAGCSNQPENTPVLNIGIGCSYAAVGVSADAGVGGTVDAGSGVVLCDDGGALPFVPGGVFAVDVTATPGSSTNVTTASAPLHATVQIVSSIVPTGATMSGTATLVPNDAGAYLGAVALAWPIGGEVDIHAEVGGETRDRMLNLASPHLDIDPQPGSQNGAQASVQVCVQSTSSGGNVSLHLEQATISGGVLTDQTLVLELGDCGPPATPTADVISHVWFTANTSVTQFLATLTLQGATATSPAAYIAPPFLITAPTIIPITVTFASPSDGKKIPIGGVVTLDARTSPSHGTVTFASSPAVAILPTTVTSVLNGSTYDAIATFGMPDLAGGAMVITATVGNNIATLTLKN